MGIKVSGRLELPARSTAPKLLTLLSVGIALASQPALSQSPMTPGGGAKAPVVAPAPAPKATVVAPQVVTPQVVAPQAPVITGAGAGGGPNVSIPQATGTTPSTPTGGKAAASAKYNFFEAWPSGVAPAPGVGVTSKMGDNVVNRMTTNNQGVAWLMRKTGNFDLTVSGGDLAKWVKAPDGPAKPVPQETLIELLVVIAIVARPANGEPQVIGRTWPADKVPQNLSVKFTVGSDSIPKGAWSDGVPLSGPPPFTDAAQTKAFQDVARTGKPGDVGVVAGALPTGQRMHKP